MGLFGDRKSGQNLDINWKKMIQNESIASIAHKIGEWSTKKLTNKLGNYWAELRPRKIGPFLDKFRWCCFFVCVGILRNTLKYSKQQKDRPKAPTHPVIEAVACSGQRLWTELTSIKLVAHKFGCTRTKNGRPARVVNHEFPFRDRHFVTSCSVSDVCFFPHVCTTFEWSPMFHNLSSFVIPLSICFLWFHPFHRFFWWSVPDSCHMFQESEERLASAFQMTERLQQSLDSANEALKSSVQSQHSKDELYTNLLILGGEWRGFQASLCLEVFFCKTDVRNSTIDSSARCKVINIWRTTGREKSPRTLVCACMTSMHQHAGEKEMHREDYRVLRWF